MANNKKEGEYVSQAERERNAELAGSPQDQKESAKADKKESTPAANKERKKPKEYNIDSLNKELTDDEQKAFKKLDSDEQKKFIIKKWIAENKTLDKSEQHEVSIADEAFVGYRP